MKVRCWTLAKKRFPPQTRWEIADRDGTTSRSEMSMIVELVHRHILGGIAIEGERKHVTVDLLLIVHQRNQRPVVLRLIR